MFHYDKTKPIKYLIFDLGGVLVDLNQAGFYSAYQALGVEEPAILYDIMKDNDFFHRYEKGYADTTELYELFRPLCRPGTTDEAIAQAWNKFLYDLPQHRLDCLLRLHSKYPIFLLSNINELHWNYTLTEFLQTNGHQVADYFDEVFLSYQMGVAKPHFESYEQVVKQTGINPAECLYLDDLDENIKAGEEIGFQTLQVETCKWDSTGIIIPPTVEWCDQICQVLMNL